MADTHFSYPGNGDVAVVFGGSGFVGTQIVRELAAQGWIVRVAVRKPSQANFLKPMGDVGQIVPLFAPATDRDKVRGAVTGARLVVNATGILAEGGKQTFERVHNKGPALIADACREFGVDRLVHISAIGADIRSASLYQRSKAAGEEAVMNRFPTATILRPSIIFGAGDDFFNRFAGMARTSPFLPLIGGGETCFQPVYVGDVADAVMSSLSDGSTQGRVYELGGPEVRTFKQLFETMLEIIQRKKRLQNISFGFAKFIARIAQIMPSPALTVDQVQSLKTDNVVSEDAATLADLGIAPKAMRAILPSYLEHYRPGGRFTVRKRYKKVAA